MMPKPAFALGFLVWSLRTIFFPFPTRSPAWAPIPVLLWRFVWPHGTCFILIVPSDFFAETPFPFSWPLAEMFTWLLVISVCNFMSLQRDMDVTPHKRELWPVDNSERKFHFRQLKYLCSAAWAFFVCVCVCVCLVLCSFITRVGSCDQHCERETVPSHGSLVPPLWSRSHLPPWSSLWLPLICSPSLRQMKSYRMYLFEIDFSLTQHIL